ncbi:MAG TPA: STAS domain-containing protein [Gemmatimonadaceae bacterium]|nr:STAS domain-containing protein [Gemmatimonadaceae bacterium]
MSAPLDVKERPVGSVTVLTVAGRLVIDDGERVLKERVTGLVAAGRANILLDLSQVRFIDSSGVGALASLLLHVVSRGGRLKLLSPSPRVDQVLRMTHVLHAFEIFDAEQAALASFDIIVG